VAVLVVAVAHLAVATEQVVPPHHPRKATQAAQDTPPQDTCFSMLVAVVVPDKSANGTQRTTPARTVATVYRHLLPARP